MNDNRHQEQTGATALGAVADNLIAYLDHLKEEGQTAIEIVPRIADDRKPATPEPARDEQAARIELDRIAKAVAACKRCVLHKQRTKSVPGQGCCFPDIMFVGEGPGEDEDIQGLAFVGRAGQLLTRLIKRMGYTRDQVFIANIVKCRPPGNRKPLPEEMTACLPYLEAQIAALQPRVIVTLGASAFEGLLHPELKIGITRLRGQWQAYRGIPLMPTFHPSYLLRTEAAMWDVWADMQEVLRRLGRTPPPKA